MPPKVGKTPRDLNPDARKELRLKKAKPLLDDFKAWLEKSIRTATLKGKLGKAIQYLLDHWQELNHYLLDGTLRIDNNLVENDIRPFAIGRKNSYVLFQAISPQAI